MRKGNIFREKRMYLMIAVAAVSMVIIAVMATLMKKDGDGGTDNKNKNLLELEEATTKKSGSFLANFEDETDGMDGEGNEQDENSEQDEMNGEDNEQNGKGTQSEMNGEGNEQNGKGAQSENDDEDNVQKGKGATNGDASQVSVIPSSEMFANTKELCWPVMGNIILDFSMDKTIYFPTLDVYRCNAGIMIQSEAGTQVCAASAGKVLEIGRNEEIGNYVKLDMGNGYTAIYGQLEDITVKVNDIVEMEKKIGTVAEPTKYYSIEGCNVYFQLNKDDTPINPIEYFAY